MYSFYNITLWVVFGICLIIALYALRRIKKIFLKYSQIKSKKSLTAEGLIQQILDLQNINLTIKQTQKRTLLNCYDPVNRIIKISQKTYKDNSLFSLGLAANLTGHVLQDIQGFRFISLYNSLVLSATLSTYIAYLVFLIGLISFYPVLINFSLVLFSLAVIFYLIAYSVESDANKRIITVLTKNNQILPEELEAIKKVLNSYAFIYLSTTLTNLIDLFKNIFIKK